MKATDTNTRQSLTSSSIAKTSGRGMTLPAVSIFQSKKAEAQSEDIVQRVTDENSIVSKVPQSSADKEGQLESNNTGMPDNLKAGIENLSGMNMDHVRVHYNSSQPAQLNALAYARGNEIHVAPGQEKHLPHEAWHVVQQAQGRVQPTTQMKTGVAVNDDPGLEHEADVMGAKALESVNNNVQFKTAEKAENNSADIIQPKWINVGVEFFQWDTLIEGVRWYHHAASNLMYFDTVTVDGENRYGKLKGRGNARTREEWVKLHGGDPLAEIDSSVGSVAHDGTMIMDNYVITPADVSFSKEISMLWDYLISKGLVAGFAGRAIHIIKAPGTVGVICHHWSFGGLNGGFNLNIAQIHGALGGVEADKPGQDDLPADFRMKEMSWDNLNVNGLNGHGATANAHIRVYNENEHSSRLKNGMYFHKFSALPFIFAVAGGDGDLIYSSVKNININALAEAALGGASTFTYRRR